jgi:hypothetical protein
VRSFLKRKCLLLLLLFYYYCYFKLGVGYFYLVHEAPLLEFSSSHLNDILPCFSKINFNNIIQSLGETGRSSSRRETWRRAKSALKFSLPTCYLLTFSRVIYTNLYPSIPLPDSLSCVKRQSLHPHFCNITTSRTGYVSSVQRIFAPFYALPVLLMCKILRLSNLNKERPTWSHLLFYFII